MKPLQCLIIDDEPIARKGILEHIDAIDYLQAFASCKDAVEALNILENNTIDVLFLDINMPKISGIDFIKSLKKPVPTVFTTAYSEHALESYELGVIDYLLKPISLARFMKTAQKLKDYYKLAIQEPTIENESFFFVKCDQRIEKIIIDDILYIEGLSNYIAIHTTTKKIITYLTFKSIEEKLPSSKFVRIHKSFLVNILAIQSLTSDEVILQKTHLPLSKNYKAAVMDLISKNFYKRS